MNKYKYKKKKYLQSSSYLSRVVRIENSSGGDNDHPAMDASHRISRCPATDSLHCMRSVILSLLLTFVSGHGELSGLRSFKVFQHTPSQKRG